MNRIAGWPATLFSLAAFLISISEVRAQQFGLYNTRTLVDVFENPAQSAYQIDTSRRFAFNFFIPNISATATFSGPASASLRSLIYDGVFNGRNIDIGAARLNRVDMVTNNYLLMFRVLYDARKSRELGISWQVRNDTHIGVTNETFAIFDDYELFPDAASNNLFNSRSYSQAYHQISAVYRQDITRQLAVGLKASLLSGIAYTRLNVDRTELFIDKAMDEMSIRVGGRLRSSFDFDDADDISSYRHLFRHPGFGFGVSALYRLPNRWSVLGNVKDLGIIRWNRNSYEYRFNSNTITIEQASATDADDRLADELEEEIEDSETQRLFYSLTDGKAELIVSKNYGVYKPSLIVSKGLTNSQGSIGLVNNVHYKDFVLGLNGMYNSGGFLGIGAQFMVKSPNAEFFMGSDHLFKSAQFIREANSEEYPYRSGYGGISFYMGIGFKFGPVLEHRNNSSRIPGFTGQGEGLFRRLLRRPEHSN